VALLAVLAGWAILRRRNGRHDPDANKREILHAIEQAEKRVTAAAKEDRMEFNKAIECLQTQHTDHLRDHVT